MSKRFRVPARLASKLEELGVPPAAVLHAAGLPARLLDQQKVQVTTEELFRLWRAIGEISRDPLIGLKLGADEGSQRYEPVVIAALCTRHFGEALQRMARYKQLTCPEEIAIDRGREECTVRFRWLLAKEMEPDILVDLCFAWVLSIARRGTGLPLTPLRVELARPHAHRALLEAHFGCAVVCNAIHNALVFRDADVERHFITHNAEMLAIIAPQLDAELNRHTQQSLPEQVAAVLKNSLAGQRPTLQNVAKDLNMSSRTLQRRLQSSGYSFQQLLEEARRELARHYLIHSPLELNETAYLLGYEDANSFVRAFHEWEGLPPAHWRQAQRTKLTL